MAWIRMTLRTSQVWVRCDDGGAPVAESGRVEIRYKEGDGRAYRASTRNLTAIAGQSVQPDSLCAAAEPVASKAPAKKGGAKKSRSKKAKAPAKAPVHPEDAVIVYADGACSGNPGPSGAGTVVIDGDLRRELSEFLGHGTNNIAELTAILRAAELLHDSERPIHIYTDSSYSIGVLTKGWKAKKNQELIGQTKKALAILDNFTLHYVPGHAGVELNEVADELATRAVADRASPGWVTVG